MSSDLVEPEPLEEMDVALEMRSSRYSLFSSKDEVDDGAGGSGRSAVRGEGESIESGNIVGGVVVDSEAPVLGRHVCMCKAEG